MRIKMNMPTSTIKKENFGCYQALFDEFSKLNA